LSTGQSGEPRALDRLNTSKDETTPFYQADQQTFYYSSDGLAGFGGQDLFSCQHFEIIDGALFPFDPQNCGATFNRHHHEISQRSFSELPCPGPEGKRKSFQFHL
jgi:hypothetical protein